MANIYISIGSNIQRHKHICAGVEALRREFGELQLSRVYESEAVGFNGAAFFNLVVGAQTQLTPQQVNAALKAIEFAHGRTADAKKFSSRTLDLDLLLYDQLITEDGVQLPRDEISYNAFVLWPLAEIAPELEHPISGISYAALWQAYQSQQVIKPVAFSWPQLSHCQE